MSVTGSSPQASACSACARPISPPSAVTAALFDMFCGLNGATESPRRVAARQRPATSSDLPTFEPAPCSISAVIAMPRRGASGAGRSLRRRYFPPGRRRGCGAAPRAAKAGEAQRFLPGRSSGPLPVPHRQRDTASSRNPYPAFLLGPNTSGCGAEPRGFQNSTPGWALMPARKGCLISVISVTRSAASTSASAALRPVSTTWVSGGFSSRRNSSTSARSR